MSKQSIQLAILLTLFTTLSCMHLSSQSHMSQPPDNQSYWNVCIATMDPKGTGTVVFLSTHSDSGEYAKNLQLYSVSHCYSNERWNLIYQPTEGKYCLQSVKFGQYLSDNVGNSRINGYGYGNPIYADHCQTSEYMVLIRTVSGGFDITANTGNWPLYYENDLSTPMFNKQHWNWWVSYG